MKVKIEVPKIFCNRTTREIGKDEIYYALLVVAGKVADNEFIPASKTPLFGKVSEVQKKVHKGFGWVPEMNNCVIDVGDAQYFAVTISLYERDNGKIYEELKKNYEEIVKPEKFDWKATMDLAVQDLSKNITKGKDADVQDLWKAVNTKDAITPLVIGGLLFALAKKIFKFLRQDDLLGVNTDYFDPTAQGFDLPREYNFRKFRGKYDVGLKVSVV